MSTARTQKTTYNPLTLTPAESRTLLAQVRPVLRAHAFEVGVESARFQNGIVPLLRKLLPEKDVLSDGTGDDECILSSVCDARPSHSQLAASEDRLAEDRQKEQGFSLGLHN